MTTINLEKINRENFRSLMNCLSMPGDIHEISPIFGSSFLAIANVLLYSEVSYFYDGTEDFDLIKAIVNAKSADLKNADYIFSDSIDLSYLQICKCGTSLNPDFSSTLIFKCDSFDGIRVRLTGPGIKNEKIVQLPINTNFVESFLDKCSNYPLGNEVFFINKKSQVLALSRTTKMEVF